MMMGYIGISIAFAILPICLGVEFSAKLNTEWNAFKATHAKQYTANEEVLRRVIWEGNVAYIQKHNLEYDRGMHTYFLGVNEYTDLSHEEYTKQLLGVAFNASSEARRDENADGVYLPPLNSAPTLPTTVDWRKHGYVTPVKNQGACGSCYAFSTTGSLEGQHYRKFKKLENLSEQQIVDCSRQYGNNGCNGGLMTNSFKYIHAVGGLDSETCYPYKARTSVVCKFKRSCAKAKVTSYRQIPQGNEKMLASAVATQGPISVAIDAVHPSFRHYKGGVYNEPQCSSVRLDHGVLVVGYGLYAGKPYWLVKNSWGALWGQRGYIMMTKDRGNQCGIASMASYPIV